MNRLVGSCCGVLAASGVCEREGKTEQPWAVLALLVISGGSSW